MTFSGCYRQPTCVFVRAVTYNESEASLSKCFPVVHTAIHNLVAQRFVRMLEDLIVDASVGSDLGAPVTACPALGLFEQLLPDSPVAVILGDV